MSTFSLTNLCLSVGVTYKHYRLIVIGPTTLMFIIPIMSEDQVLTYREEHDETKTTDMDGIKAAKLLKMAAFVVAKPSINI